MFSHLPEGKNPQWYERSRARHWYCSLELAVGNKGGDMGVPSPQPSPFKEFSGYLPFKPMIECSDYSPVIFPSAHFIQWLKFSHHLSL